MTTLAFAQGLYVWTITLENGAVLTRIGSSLDTLISGNLPSPVVSATRGPAFSTDGPPPTVSQLTPNTAILGSANFTLHVIGTGFRQGCTIVFAGRDEPTTFVSATELTTGVNMAVWLGPDSIPVAVRSLGGVTSNALPFTFTASE